MVECIGPELDSKVCTSEEGSNRFREGLVSTFNRVILERSFSTSGLDFIPFGSEEVLNLWIVIEFTALVQVNILVLIFLARGILREEIPKPFNRRGFGSPSVTIFHTDEMISD